MDEKGRKDIMTDAPGLTWTLTFIALILLLMAFTVAIGASDRVFVQPRR